MSRFVAVVESQAAQLAGVPSGLTFNGYFAAIPASASGLIRLRRLRWHVRGPAGSVTSDQHSIAIYRQTVRAAGTGFSTTAWQNTDGNGIPALAPGIDITTAAAAGTTGPTIGANALAKTGGNTQIEGEVSFEFPDDQWSVPTGLANAFALVNIGNPLPASHLFVVTAFGEE